MDTTERSEFRIYAPSERKSLLTMRKDDYENEFSEYRQLLILKRGQIVVAATTGDDRIRLEETFLDAYPEEVDSLMMFVTGPVGMQETLEGGGMPTPTPPGRTR